MKKKNLITLSHSALWLYADLCKPVCMELGIPQTAFDILMFLTNNPEFDTAKDITRYGGIKKNLVSMHVEKLVNQGYIERQNVPGDRRQVKLVVTDKAFSVTDKGRRVQKYYYDFLIKGLSDEELKVYRKCVDTISDNVDELNRKIKTGAVDCK